MIFMSFRRQEDNDEKEFYREEVANEGIYGYERRYESVNRYRI
jgi:hypothetical protein